MQPIPVILIFDVGKTNKKLLLFDERYTIVHEESTRLEEITDEDGFPCEDIHAVTNWIISSQQKVFADPKYDVKAINFSGYGASFVYVNADGKAVLPLYNYLKPYPDVLLAKFYNTYGGEEEFARQTASPVLGSLNSGLQLYRIKHDMPEAFNMIKYALHLPQYLSSVISGFPVSEITSIGCHTNLWNFETNTYHEWLDAESISPKLPPIHKSDECTVADINEKKVMVGIGLHDSSSALIPYLAGFHESFILLSTGTWCISLNPFNDSPLTKEELKYDCLNYITYQGCPVKASRIFAGYEHEQQTKRLAEHFSLPVEYFNTLDYNVAYISADKKDDLESFANKNLAEFSDVEEAYHALVNDIVKRQLDSTNHVLKATKVKRLFVDGGFSNNSIFMHLMARAFPELEVFAASVPAASALGAALAIHKHWNHRSLPSNSIQLKFYSNTE